ncbi:hypothetical protein HKT18_00695 [Flavobacterium sp. IMCC34852]|uniref:Antibiotic biosynthesis monooxygenase n=1 Tax=Flavobacterium rivulicola TaxID=2732161 RepID=A0A7Y3R6I4_9FLAO|nr:hypothetical protein [Flavobacterium sp. IMCC34852]NNT70721.1 hypothetical protein [Flavobacterium sp. IMCC34852]
MKTMKSIFLVVIFGLLMSNTSFAQEEKSYLITVTKLHWNMELENFSMDEWKATEKEYLDKVVKKNEFILGQEFLMHHFTPDNTEILLVTTYENWSAVEKAGNRDDELVKAAWPDEKARKAFFEKKALYYAHHHSDEIYATIPGAKLPKANFDKDMLYYVRVSHFAYPKDGTEKEFTELSKQYFDAVINKNDLIKAYYPNRHAWGADNTEFTEVYVVETLADLEKALEKNRELFRATWNDDAKRKAFWDKRNKYDDGRHSDYIYKLIHELSK